MTSEQTKWYWISAAPMIIFGGLGFFLVLHGMTFVGGGVALFGLLIKTFINYDPYHNPDDPTISGDRNDDL